MITILLTILAFLVMAAALCVSGRFFLHRLQLSSYQFQGYFARLRSDKKHLIPIFAAALSLIFLRRGLGPLGLILTDAAAILALRQGKTAAKTKFVVTARVKRLMATMALILAVVLLVGYLMGGLSGLAVAGALYLGLLSLVTALANLINRPLEKAVQNWYIKDAQRILQSMPRLKIIGITGSYGKTSVKSYLATLLGEQYRVLRTPGSFNTPMGVVRTIRESLSPTHDIFLCEMGARHVGDITELCDIVHPQFGVLTAIGSQHLETFRSQENIVNEKYEILRSVKDRYGDTAKGADSPVPGETVPRLFLNGDNALIRENLRYPEAVRYGFGEDCAYRAKILSVSRRGTEFEVTVPEGSTAVFTTKLLGRHNVENITGAIAVAHSFGISMDKLRPAVRRIEQVPHRLELTGNDMYTVIDDAYNSNPSGAAAALEVLSLFDGMKILVTPGMVELGDVQAAENAKFTGKAAAVCDYIVTVGSTNAQALRRGADEAGYDMSRFHAAQNLAEAMDLARALETGRPRIILLENDLPENYN